MRRIHLLQICIAMLGAASTLAQETGFKPIFDPGAPGLDGWKAPNMSYWSVRDGIIVAQSTQDNPVRSNQFLVWQGGDVADFELKLKFRLAGNQGNSGIQFRSSNAKSLKDRPCISATRSQDNIRLAAHHQRIQLPATWRNLSS